MASDGYVSLTVKAGPHESPIGILVGLPGTVGGVLVAEAPSPAGEEAFTILAVLACVGLLLWATARARVNSGR